MTLKESRPTDESGNNDSQDSNTGSQKALSLEELASRQQAAMAKLQETASAFDTLLEEAKARAQEIVSAADNERRNQSRMAKHKVEELIKAARSSAGQVAKQDSEQLPALTGEIWSALEASIEPHLQTLLDDLENLKQETELLDDRESPMPDPMATGLDEAESELIDETEPEIIDEPEPENDSEPEIPASIPFESDPDLTAYTDQETVDERVARVLSKRGK